jgi:hypothetical protein
MLNPLITVPYNDKDVDTAARVFAPRSCNNPTHSRKYFSPGEAMLCANWKRRVLAARQGDCWFAGGEVGVVAFVVNITEGGDGEEEEGADGPKHWYKKELGLKGATAGMERDSNCSIAKLLRDKQHTKIKGDDERNERPQPPKKRGEIDGVAIVVICAVSLTKCFRRAK